MLQLRELQKTFFRGTPNEVRALRGVSVEIEEGSFVIVIGTNGSGKSTLLNAAAGSFFVDGGAIHIGGRDVTRWPEHRRASMIGRVCFAGEMFTYVTFLCLIACEISIAA